ncbi:MAG: hypothetical protein ABI406_17755 [Ktedonobacteraceae bacterium]
MDIEDSVIGNIGNTANPSKLLLPFTHGVNAHALEYAVLLAKSRHATLVPFSLIYVPYALRGARLESIQQSKDFLALVQSKAAKHGVTIEPQEVYTSDAIESIHRMTQELHCSNIILFVRDGDGVLLSTNEVKHILTLVPGQHHVIRLQRNASRLPMNPFKRIARILPRQRKERILSGTSFS